MSSSPQSHALEAHTLASLQNDRRTTALGLLWGGVLLVLLAVWLPAKHPDIHWLAPAGVWILAAAAFITALAQWFLRPRGTDEEQRRQLAARRRPAGAVLTVA